MAKSTAWTKRARKRFLEEFRKTANATAAAAFAGIPRSTAYDQRHRDPIFAAEWTEAEEEAADTLEAEAQRRAVEGVLEPVFYLGQEVGHIRKYSDRLLELLLKGHKPTKFRENLSAEITGAGGGPIQYSNLDRANRLATLMAEAKKRRDDAKSTEQEGGN